MKTGAKSGLADSDVSCGSCAGTNSKNVWFIGISIIVLAAVFCFAIFSNKAKPVPAQDPATPVMVMGGAGQQAAFSGGNCMTTPSYSQCFPQLGTNGAQQVAFVNPNCIPCPSFTQCFPQGGGGGAQQVAFANPNCMTCPNFTQCFPQGTTGTPQQVAFGPGSGALSCPFCNFVYTDASVGARGQSRCPNCFGVFGFPGFGRGRFTTVALTNPIAAPPIFRDAVMPHEYRGVCENCHQIMPDIAIPPNAQMPHEYRGVCSNCHTILGTKAGA